MLHNYTMYIQLLYITNIQLKTHMIDRLYSR